MLEIAQHKINYNTYITMSKEESKNPWSLMPADEKLYWKDGHTNLQAWLKALQVYGRLKLSEEIIQAVFIPVRTMIGQSHVQTKPQNKRPLNREV